MWFIHIMESYSALKRNETVTHSTPGLNLEDTVGKENEFCLYTSEFLAEICNKRQMNKRKTSKFINMGASCIYLGETKEKSVPPRDDLELWLPKVFSKEEKLQKK